MLVIWQSYLRGKELKELPSLPKKEKKFKLLSNKVKNKVSQTKKTVREKFNAYILQKKNRMKLEYQVIKLKRKGRWSCNSAYLKEKMVQLLLIKQYLTI